MTDFVLRPFRDVKSSHGLVLKAKKLASAS